MGDVGIVLVGGRSSRMGVPKASLEWHGSNLLRRTVGILARALRGPILVVRAPAQSLPDLPEDVLIVADDQEGRGPLQGLAAGLAGAADHAERAFVCSTDLPFLHPEFVRRVLAALDTDTDVVLPIAGGHRQPLAAGYRTRLADRVQQLLDEGARKPAMLFDVVHTTRLDDTQLLMDPRLAAADPQLLSVANVNDPAEYEAARRQPAPTVSVQRYGVLSRHGHHRRRTVRAATLSRAADAVGLTLDRHVVAALNGDRMTHDGHVPLVAGDEIAFLSADAGG